MPGYTYTLKFPTGEFYIGSTTDLVRRYKQHLKTLDNGTHQNVKMQALYISDIIIDYEVDVFATIEEAQFYEQRLIQKNSGNKLMLNIGLNAVGGDNLTLHPDREKIIERRVTSQLTTNAKLSSAELSEKYGKFGEANGMFGETHTDEIKEFSRQLNMGNQNAKGTIRSQKHRLQLSDRAKKRVGELNPFHGKTHSVETRKKLSEMNKGKLPPNTKRVSIDGKVYVSATAAAKELGVAVMTIVNRINNQTERFSGYTYLD